MLGKIIRWNDDRGFGFISIFDRKGDVFAHISSFKKGYRRPRVGDSVQFQIVNDKGKEAAKSISLVGVKPLQKDKSSFVSTLTNLLFFVIFAIVIYFFVIEPKLNPTYEQMDFIKSKLNHAYEERGFSCQGKTHCSQMISCDEAKYYLAHCPNVKINGDHDGEPCESQLCDSR